MARLAKNKEAAWTFVEYANSHEGQTIIAGSGRTVPSLVSVAQSKAFLDPDAKPDNSAVFIDTIPNLKRVPTMATWSAVEEIASREIERAFYGQATVEEAAQAAVDLTFEYFTP